MRHPRQVPTESQIYILQMVLNSLWNGGPLFLDVGLEVMLSNDERKQILLD
jgi:hypothetical protein